MIKFTKVKLNGEKDKIDNEPIQKGVKYRIKKQLFKNLSIIYKT